MIILLELSFVFIGVVFAVYFSYFILVLRTRKKEEYIKKLARITENQFGPEELPNVTILIPAYNEEETVYDKIRNINEFNYLQNKIKIFVLDDNSEDKTREIAEKAFGDFGLNGKIIQNETRKGVNASYNQAIPQVNSEYVLTTDADSRIPPDTLLRAVKVLIELKDVGGVAAKMIPSRNKATPATRTAIAYANSYNSMLIAESAIYSTFPGSTSCMLMRKSAFSPIQTSYGSSDGNISLGIIKNGFRFIFSPQIEYFEPITENLMEQRRQKIRRATRLIQSTVLNRKIIFNKQYGVFGNTIFPLRFLMMAVCPLLFFLSAIFYLIFAYLVYIPVFLTLVLVVGVVLVLGTKTNKKILNWITSFVIHQIYLLVGLILSPRKMNIWKKIERRKV
jgi:biofilm PGA synthesis N-glycosyltransferase PgaC